MQSPFAQWFQAEIQVLEPGKAEVRLPVRGEFLQGRGVVHGGILAALLDTALGHAVSSLGVEAVTVELSVSYLRPVREGLLQAQAQVVHAGGRLFHATGEALLEGARVALAKGIFYRVA